MPSIGEQGWGDLMNGNLTTIDTTMKGLNTRMGTAETNITSLTTRMGTAETTITSNKSRIGTLETETDAVEERVTALEKGEFKGEVSAETFSGALYVNAALADTGIGDYIVTTSGNVSKNTSGNASNTLTLTTDNIVINNATFNKKKGFEFDVIPVKITINAKLVSGIDANGNTKLYVYHNGTQIASASGSNAAGSTISTTTEVNVLKGDTFYAYATVYDNGGATRSPTLTLEATELTGNIYLG